MNQGAKADIQIKPPESKFGLGYDRKHVIEEAEAITAAMNSEEIAKELSEELILPVRTSLETGKDSQTRLEVCPILNFWRLKLYIIK